MRRLILLALFAFATAAHGAYSNQATQPWVQMKLSQLESTLRAEIEAMGNRAMSATNAVDVTNIVETSMIQATSQASAAFASMYSFNMAYYLGGLELVPTFEVTGESAAMISYGYNYHIPTNSVFVYMSDNVFTNTLGFVIEDGGTQAVYHASMTTNGTEGVIRAAWFDGVGDMEIAFYGSSTNGVYYYDSDSSAYINIAPSGIWR